MTILPEERAEVAALLREHGVEPRTAVVFGLSGPHPTARWPLDACARYLQMVQTHVTAPIVLIGGEDDQSAADQLISRGDGLVVNLVGRLPLRRLAALIESARWCVSFDPMTILLARAVGCPSVYLQGGRGSTIRLPDEPAAKVVQPYCYCMGRSARQPDCRVVNAWCMKAISSDEVFKASLGIATAPRPST